MKMIKAVFPKVFGFFLVLTLICGVIYPAAVTGISKIFFAKQSVGSIIEVNGVKYGSELVAQEFTGNQYLWGRVMNVDVSTFTGDSGEPLMYAWASNKSPASEEYAQMIQERVKKIQEAHPEKAGEPVPEDLVTCSGSGLDPDISPAAAEYQVARIARTRGITEEDVRQVIKKYTKGRTLGVLGEPAVNVLKVNLALDGILEE